MLLWLMLVLLLVLYALDVHTKIYNYYRVCHHVRKVPGLPTHWLWGNVHQIEMNQAYFEQMYNWRNDNDLHVIKLWLGPFIPNIIVSHPNLIKQLLKEPKAIDAYSVLKPWLGEGLLIANHDKWYRSRRMLTPAFHFDILKPYVYVYNECADILLNKWSVAASDGRTVEVHKTISRLTLDVILRCACSFHSNCQDPNSTDPYVGVVRELCDISITRMLIPLHVVMGDILYFTLTSNGRKFKKALKIAHTHSEKDESVSKARSSHKYLDFLDILLTAKDDNGVGLSDIDIRNEVDTFVFEGHDTTASAITWTLYCLAKHCEHQEKCREEVRDVLRGRAHLDYDDLPKLHYTTMCIREALRLYPPVYHIHRQPTEDIELGGFIIPKGVFVTLDIMGIMRDPDIWNDAMTSVHEYNPLRFEGDGVSERDPFAFMPFSAGPRNCIGQNFALNEEKVVIASILNRFSFELVEEEEIEFVPVVILRLSRELKLKLTEL